MSFPQTPLTVLVEVFLGADLTAAPTTWVATDATALTFDRSEDSIAITRGRPDQSRTADPSTLAMTGDNRGGHWASRNANSPWYGRLHKGTPVRVSAGGQVRYTGFFSELPPRWDVTGVLRWVPLKAMGLLYRLGLEGAPERSALRRTIEYAAPDRYWPLEDGPNALAGASAFVGGASTSPLTGAALFTTSTLAAGSAGGVDVAGGSFTAPTGQVIAAAPSGWEFEFVTGWDVLPTVALSTCQAIAYASSSGAAAFMGVGVTNVAGVIMWADFLTANDGSGSFQAISGLGAIVAGRAYHVRVVGTQVGLGVRVTVYVDGVSIFADGFNETLMMPDRIVVNGSAAPTAAPANVPFFAHLAFWASVRVSATTYLAANGYLAEQAHTRFLRLCTEEGVLGTCTATESLAMGPQLPAAFLPLLRDLEASDQGYLYEGLDFGLTYQSHTQRENMTTALALDYTTAGHVSPPLEPTEDDQDIRNDITVKRERGSSARTESASTDEFGRANIGRRKDEKTYSLATDDMTPHVAGWRLHMLTWPGYRWPVLTVNLAAAPSLITSLTAAGLAFRTTIAHPPADAGSSTIDLITDGYSETIKQYDWLWQGNCVLSGPWKVGVLAATTGETDTTGWLDFDTCLLHTGVNTTATTWAVDAVPIDAAVADDLPRDHLIEGELIRVTAVSGGAAPQTWTVTRSVNGVVKSHVANVPITLAYPFVLAL